MFHNLNSVDTPTSREIYGLTSAAFILPRAIVQTLSYLDFTIIYKTILPFFEEIGKNPFYQILGEKEYWDLSSKQKPVILGSVPGTGGCFTPAKLIYGSPRVDKASLALFLFSRLGPKGFWDFVFETPYEKQLEISLREHPGDEFGGKGFWRDRNEDRDKKAYPPILRILRDELIVGPGDYKWWDCWDYDSAIVDPSVAFWDDWRLKQWGFYLPTIKPNLLLPGLTAAGSTTIGSSEGTFWYKEHAKPPRIRNTMFPEMEEEKVDSNEACSPVLVDSDEFRNVKEVEEQLSVSLNLPLELQLHMLGFTSSDQYQTLKLVCKSWKHELYRILKKRYREPFYPDQEWIESRGLHKLRSRDREHYSLVPCVEVKAPDEPTFLVHSALYEFTGYLRGRMDYSSEKLNRRMWEDDTGNYPLEIGRLYSTPNPDDATVLANTERFKQYADDPIVIPSTDNPEWIPHRVYLTLLIDSSGDNRWGPKINRGPSMYVGGGDKSRTRLDLPSLKLKDFFGWYFGHRGIHKLRSLPKDKEDLKPGVVFCGATPEMRYRLDPSFAWLGLVVPA
ncbi:hypothetical protein TWF281_011019 [Arthrobotrys megalospora]